MSKFTNGSTPPSADGLTGDDRIDDLVSRFRTEQDCLLAGLLKQASVFHEARRTLSRDDLEWFCTALYVSGLDRMFLGHIGDRLWRLDKLLGSELVAYAKFSLLTKTQKDFEASLEEAKHLRAASTLKLMEDITEFMDAYNVVPGDDGSPPEVFGIRFEWIDDPAGELRSSIPSPGSQALKKRRLDRDQIVCRRAAKSGR
jgi:hypothetical protein